MLERYRSHADARAAVGVPTLPFDSEQTASLVELLNTPRAEAEIS